MKPLDLGTCVRAIENTSGYENALAFIAFLIREGYSEWDDDDVLYCMGQFRVSYGEREFALELEEYGLKLESFPRRGVQWAPWSDSPVERG